MNKSSKIEVIEAGRMSENEMGLVFGGDAERHCSATKLYEECGGKTTSCANVYCAPHVYWCGDRYDYCMPAYKGPPSFPVAIAVMTPATGVAAAAAVTASTLIK